MYPIASINNSDIGWESQRKNKKKTRIERIHQIQNSLRNQFPKHIELSPKKEIYLEFSIRKHFVLLSSFFYLLVPFPNQTKPKEQQKYKENFEEVYIG